MARYFLMCCCRCVIFNIAIALHFLVNKESPTSLWELPFIEPWLQARYLSYIINNCTRQLSFSLLCQRENRGKQGLGNLTKFSQEVAGAGILVPLSLLKTCLSITSILFTFVLVYGGRRLAFVVKGFFYESWKPSKHDFLRTCPLKLKTEDLDTINVTGICKHCLIHFTSVSGHMTVI